MRYSVIPILLLLLVATIRCQPDEPVDPGNTNGDSLTGMVEFDFPLPLTKAPPEGIHRIDLGVAKTSYDLYRGAFLISTNTSDRQQVYTFRLLPGDYYFQAGITCTCQGDTCLWAGFPGGRLGTRWAMDRITITRGEILKKSIVFPN